MKKWSQRTWFITGASKGFGRVMAQTIIARGGRVVATARDPEMLEDLVAQADGRAIAVKLDVTDADNVIAGVRAAEAFGGIDVLLNNAGYGFVGGIEESGDEEIERQFDTNFFGALRTIRAALPAMRTRGGGYILSMSSIAGVRSFAGSGYYSATKFALEAISEALVGEIAPFGIKVLIIEPSHFRTEFSGGSIALTSHGLPAYGHLARRRAKVAQIDGHQPGDPVRGADAIIQAMESESPPLRLALGGDAYQIASDMLKGRRAELDAWRDLTRRTDFDS